MKSLLANILRTTDQIEYKAKKDRFSNVMRTAARSLICQFNSPKLTEEETEERKKFPCRIFREMRMVEREPFETLLGRTLIMRFSVG